MLLKRLLPAALVAAAFIFLPLSANAQTPPQDSAAAQKPEDQPSSEYKKPRRAPRSHVHYEGDGHDHSKDKAGAQKPAAHATHSHSHADETFEPEALFAFTSASRIGDKGDKHIITSFAGNWGRHDGSYKALTPSIEFGFNPHERLHIAMGVWGDYFKIQNVTGLEDRDRWGAGAALEFKVALLKRREEGPVGVTLIIAPHIGNIEHGTADRARHYAVEVKLAADTELIRDQLLLAGNIFYQPEHVKFHDISEPEKHSLLGYALALMAKVTPRLLFGIEAQYLRAYEGYGLNTFEGRAFYLGPTLHFKVSDKEQFVMGWQTQVSGRAVDDPRSLDLVNFDRNRARVFYSKHF